MDVLRKHLVIPLVLCVLAVAFAAICLMVEVTRRADPWLRRKLRIGALILSLQTVAAGAATASASCYEPAVPPPPRFSVSVGVTRGAPTRSREFTLDIETLLVSRADLIEIPGTVEGGAGSVLSYAITAGTETIVQAILRADDGSYDSTEEAATIRLPVPQGTPDQLELRVYWGDVTGERGVNGCPLVSVYAIRFQ